MADLCGGHREVIHANRFNANVAIGADNRQRYDTKNTFPSQRKRTGGTSSEPGIRPRCRRSEKFIERYFSLLFRASGSAEVCVAHVWRLLCEKRQYEVYAMRGRPLPGGMLRNWDRLAWSGGSRAAKGPLAWQDRQEG